MPEASIVKVKYLTLKSYIVNQKYFGNSPVPWVDYALILNHPASQNYILRLIYSLVIFLQLK